MLEVADAFHSFHYAFHFSHLPVKRSKGRQKNCVHANRNEPPKNSIATAWYSLVYVGIVCYTLVQLGIGQGVACTCRSWSLVRETSSCLYVQNFLSACCRDRGLQIWPGFFVGLLQGSCIDSRVISPPIDSYRYGSSYRSSYKMFLADISCRPGTGICVSSCSSAWICQTFISNLGTLSAPSSSPCPMSPTLKV